jgi:hypothetical protein
MDLTCIICLEEIDNISNKKTLECEHMFHKECYLRYINYKPNHLICPICNIPIIHNIIKTNIIIPKNTKTNYGFNLIYLKNFQLINYLNRFNIYSNDINKYLNQNLILSHDFLLLTILNKPLSINKLKFYTNYYSNSCEYHEFKHYLISRCNYDTETFLIEDTKKTYKTKEVLYNQNNPLKKIYIYTFKQNIKKFIRDKFPLNIIKNYYDGSDIYAYDTTAIINKTDYLKRDPNTHIFYNRMYIKYIKYSIQIKLLNN